MLVELAGAGAVDWGDDRCAGRDGLDVGEVVDRGHVGGRGVEEVGDGGKGGVRIGRAEGKVGLAGGLVGAVAGEAAGDVVGVAAVELPVVEVFLLGMEEAEEDEELQRNQEGERELTTPCYGHGGRKRDRAWPQGVGTSRRLFACW